MDNKGIIRKIDELGRIVIPKEIRRMLSIRDGENLQIIIDNDCILIKKYNYFLNITDIAIKLVDVYKSVGDHNIIICDREKIISCSLSNECVNNPISDILKNYIDSRESKVINTSLTFGHLTLNGYFLIVPVINNIDCIGLIILHDNLNSSLNNEIPMIKLLSKILSDKINIC